MRKIALFSLILVGLFLVACGETPQTQTKDVFFGGTNGVEAKFELMGGEQDNIDTIYDSEAFLVEVTLNNKGEHELAPEDANVRLLGQESKLVKGLKTNPPPTFWIVISNKALPPSIWG